MTMTTRSRSLLGVAVAALAPAALLATTALTPAIAQDYTSGAIAGNVVDGSGNAVAGATVTVRSQSQGFSRSTTTSSSGGFRFTGLPGGAYDVSVESGAGSTNEEGVRVTAGSTANYTFVVGAAASSGTGGDEVVVSATRQNLDFANTTTGINIDVEDLTKDIPVGRDLTSLTLFAPGVAQGDGAFGNLSSLSGASVAENAYYLNGLNITNFDNYLGSALVPFEFYKSVEVKTGGYAAEYGRAIGGIVNAVTKTGSNDFGGSIHINWTPEALRSDSPDTYLARNALDERETSSAIVDFSGPIIKDHLFFYGIAEFRNDTFRDSGITTQQEIEDKDSDPFFGFKLDGYLNADHHLEFTYWDTDRTTFRSTRRYNSATDTVLPGVTGRTRFDNGGASYVGKYTGVIAPWLTISAAYGQSDDKFEVNPESGLNRVQDARAGTAIDLSNQVTTTKEVPYTTNREFYRADADLYFNLLGDHHWRLGFDKEKLSLDHVAVRTGPGLTSAPTLFPGGLLYIYRRCGTSTAVCNGDNQGLNFDTLPGPATNGSEYVELNYFNSGGSFQSENTAFYIQDEWEVSNRLTLNLGVRLDQFENFTADGSKYIDFSSEIAPRVGFSYDVLGNGRSKLYGNYGIYFLPVASNTAFRQGAQEWFFREYWTFTSIGANGIPVLGAQVAGFSGSSNCPFGLANGGGAGLAGACQVTGRGLIQDPTASISRNLKATKEREIIVGYEQDLSDLWTVGVSYTRRDTKITAEDVAIDAAVLAYCNDPANGVDQSTTACSSIWTGFHQYVIINPGSDSTIQLNTLLPGETAFRTIDFTAAQLGYPAAERTYDAVQFTFDREFDGKWSLSGSYTWSKSKGNTEGYVKSDVGQDDAGITQDFDQPGLTDGTFGFLPNHRAHQFKAWGSYAVSEALTLGFNAQLSSPRKFGCLGVHPTDVFAALYGAASFYCDLDGDGTNELTPRGSVLESDWIKNVNVSARYNIELPTGTQATLRADVFNIFNFSGVQDLDEFGELNNGAANVNYGLPTAFQTPRSVRLGLDIGF